MLPNSLIISESVFGVGAGWGFLVKLAAMKLGLTSITQPPTQPPSTCSTLQDCPHVMDKLRAEQQALVAKHGERITPAALKDMTYADAVIK